jgi:hypothetical protein
MMACAHPASKCRRIAYKAAITCYLPTFPGGGGAHRGKPWSAARSGKKRCASSRSSGARPPAPLRCWRLPHFRALLELLDRVATWCAPPLPRSFPSPLPCLTPDPATLWLGSAGGLVCGARSRHGPGQRCTSFLCLPALPATCSSVIVILCARCLGNGRHGARDRGGACCVPGAGARRSSGGVCSQHGASLRFLPIRRIPCTGR